MPSFGNRLSAESVGGAVVLRPFRVGETLMPRGSNLSREQVLTLRAANREALINGGFMKEFPLSQGGGGTDDGRRFVCRRADLKYDVVVGHPINDDPLTRNEAEELARNAVPAGG